MKIGSIISNWNISHGEYQRSEDIYTKRRDQIVKHEERLQRAVFALYGITATGIIVFLLGLAAKINF